MALKKAKPENIPKDAVMLTEIEALEYEKKILKSWKKTSDVLAIKYGSVMLGFGSLFVGSYVNFFYRRKFKLFELGQTVSYLPATFIPAISSYMVHLEFVTNDVILNKSCPICLELRAASMQSVLGCLFPVVLAQLSSLSFATRYATYNVPFVSQEPLKVIKLLATMTKPIKNVLFGIFMAQAVFASVITYFEQKSVEKVNERLMELEYDLEGSDLLKQ